MLAASRPGNTSRLASPERVVSGSRLERNDGSKAQSPCISPSTSRSAALGIGATLADALWLIVAGLGIFTFGFFAVHSVASAWVGHRAGPRRGLVSALYLSSYYLGGSLLGTAAGWAWSHGGWPGVLAALLVCAGLVIGIALRLRRLAGD